MGGSFPPTPAPYSSTIKWVSGGADFGTITPTIICDDYTDTVTAGEHWTATVWDGSQIFGNPIGTPAGSTTDLSNTRFGGLTANPVTHVAFTASTTTLYEQAAYLALQEQSTTNSVYQGAIQTAIWLLFDPGANALTSKYDTGSGMSLRSYWTNAASTWVSGASLQQLDTLASYVAFLTPTQRTGHNIPQEFILVSTPEPATDALFGAGLILLSLGTFRRRRNKKS